MKKTVSWLLSIMLGTLLIFTTTPSTTVHASNDTLQPFYNNPLNPNPDAIYTGGGVEYFFRYAAIDNITGNRAYSSTNWNTNSTINWYTTVPNNSDIYNRDYAHDLALCGQLNNVTTTDANVNIKLQLPYYPSRTLVPDPDRLTSNPTTGTYSSTLRVSYDSPAGNYTYDEIQALPSFDWSTVTSINFYGSIRAGETLTLDIPMKLTTDEQVQMSTIVYSYSPAREGTAVQAVSSAYRYKVADKLHGVFIGTIRESDSTYRQVPANIQALMPAVNSSNIRFNMFSMMLSPVDFTQPSDGLAFSNTSYSINNEPIFAAVKDEGYSVQRTPAGDLMTSYRYLLGSTGLNLIDTDGNPLTTDTFDAAANVQLSPFYVELVKVLDTQDITLHVGDSWDPFDNLTYHQFGSTVINTSDISITHNDVDTTTPGNYTITYSTEVAPGRFVTKTASVRVLGNSNVNYSFVSQNGEVLPSAVTDLLPSAVNGIAPGTVITAQAPAQTEITVSNGKWVFVGYDHDTFTADGTDTTFIGTWKFILSQNTAVSPQTSDHTNITGYIFLLAGAVIILCFAAYRKFASKK